MLGFGRIGQQVARRALGLGMRVVALRPVRRRGPLPRGGRRAGAELGDALAAADFVTLHLPLTDETTRDRSAPTRSRRCSDGARLVNAARGALVDEEALVEAIRSGKLAGAALDVFSAEPYRARCSSSTTSSSRRISPPRPTRRRTAPA